MLVQNADLDSICPLARERFTSENGALAASVLTYGRCSGTSSRPVCRRCGVELSSEDSQSGFCFSCLLLPALDLDESGEFTGSGSRFDHYEVRTRADGSLFELGRGSMGVTYEAIDTRLQFRVALKVINARGARQAGS